MTADSGSFGLSGQAVDLILAKFFRLMLVQATTTGQDVTFNKALNLSATSGTFTLSLQGAAKLITEVTPNGSFTLQGKT